jgi:hypothetical protein
MVSWETEAEKRKEKKRKEKKGKAGIFSSRMCSLQQN